MQLFEFKAIDLFSGAGGLTLGLKQAGFKILAGIENNSVAAETYRLNHPEVMCLEKDIRNVDIEQLMIKLNLQKGDLDLLAGCPPCQGFSSLRTRKKSVSEADSRNDLIFEFLRFVEELEPKAVMLENVPALVKDERIEVFLESLKKMGYLINHDSLSIEDAANFGVPQRRKRLIVKIMKNGLLPKVSYSNKKITVRECFSLANLPEPGSANDPLHDYVQRRSEKVAAIIKAIPKNGGGRKDLPEHLVLDCHKKRPGQFADVYGRMKWDEVSPTITGGCSSPSKGRFLHPEDNRCITLREAALLQSFPKSYKFSLKGGQTSTALMIGNALPPELIRRHSLSIIDALKAYN